MSHNIDSKAFRNALGSFATGVTVITCLDKDGKSVGATVSSFNSVSMDPHLILWSINKADNSADAFINAREFVFNILASNQVDLSNQFARSNEDKFVGVDTENGLGEVPMLVGAVTHFQCQTWASYDGGDHQIIVGEVVAMDTNDDEGLVFYRGDYAKPEKR